jgi:hypothetical protein
MVVIFPSGTTAQRPSPQNGVAYVDLDLGRLLLISDGTAWHDVNGVVITNGPKHMQAVVNSDNSIALTWDRFPGATSYKLYEDQALTGVVGATALTTTATTRAPAELRTYHYWVTALVGGVESEPSGKAEAGLPYIAPAPPVGDPGSPGTTPGGPPAGGGGDYSPGAVRPAPAPTGVTVTATSASAAQTALNAANAGSVIFLSGNLGATPLTMSRSGASGNPIKIVGDGNSTIGGLELTGDWIEVHSINIVAPPAPGLSVTGTNMLIENVVIDGPTGGDGDCCRFWGSFLTFRHCTFKNTDDSTGAHADAMQNYSTDAGDPRTHDILIENCSMENIDNMALISEGPNSSAGDGDHTGHTTNITISKCYCKTRVAAQAVWFDDVQNWTIKDTTFEGTGGDGLDHAVGADNGSTGGTISNCKLINVPHMLGMSDNSKPGYTGPASEVAP